MTTQGKRGRPKGTGINDHETLLKIAALISANPSMKRTTAIKQAGITNPSVVRRLRDKYQEHETSLLAEIAAKALAAKPAAEAPAKAETGKKGKAAAAAAAAAANTARATTTQAAAPAAAQATSQPAAAKAAPAAQQPDLLSSLLGGLTIESLVSDFLGQLLGTESKQPESPIVSLIRQQAHLVDLVMPLLMSQVGPKAGAAVKAA